MELQGILVIGNQWGLGSFIARTAAQRGAAVVHCAEESNGIMSDRQAKVLHLLLDEDGLLTEAEVDRLFDGAQTNLPSLHAVIISSPSPSPSYLTDLSLSDWQCGYLAPLRQLFLLSQRAMREFLAGGVGGRLVYIMAGSGIRDDIIGQALSSLVRSLTKEYACRGMACNAMMVSHVPSSAHETPLLERTQDICEIALFLSSPEASYVNGELWHIR